MLSVNNKVLIITFLTIDPINIKSFQLLLTHQQLKYETLITIN
jgi:hypothetical protein